MVCISVLVQPADRGGHQRIHSSSSKKSLPLQFNFQCKRNKNVKMHFKYFFQMAKFFSLWLSTSFLVLVRRAAAGRAARRTARSKSVCCPCCLVCIRPLCTSANDNSATLTFFDHFDKRLWLLQEEEYLSSWKKKKKSLKCNFYFGLQNCIGCWPLLVMRGGQSLIAFHLRMSVNISAFLWYAGM